MFGGDITALGSLLEESQKQAEKRDAVKSQPPMATGTTVVKGRSDALKAAEESRKESEDLEKKIFKVEEAPNEDALLCNSAGDDREVPRYEFSYKQSVGTQDTFLGMNDITPSSADCSHLIVKIHFPGCTMKELDLDVTKNRIRAESKTLKLFTYLPVNVDHNKGNAKFDKEKAVLTCTLPIIHWLQEQLE